MNGHGHLYGDWEYESGYGDGYPSPRHTCEPLWKHLGYSSEKQMRKAQQKYAATKSALQSFHEFEDLTK